VAFTVRPLLLAGVLYVVFETLEPPWYVPVQLFACVLFAYVLLCVGRDLRPSARPEPRCHQPPRPTAVMAIRVSAEIGNARRNGTIGG
jgi:hypothetical protein